jgi:PAS domain S-box-containing protein
MWGFSLLGGVCIFILFIVRHKLIKYKNEQKTVVENLKKEHLKLTRKYEENISYLTNQLAEKDHLAMIARQTPNAIMLMDAKGNIKWINESFTRLYEYTFEEFTKKLGNNIRQTSFSPLIQERLNRCINGKMPVTYEALNITKTGKEIWTHTSLVPLLNESNEVVGLVTIDSDIHKRIKAGESMAKFIYSFNKEVDNLSEQLGLVVDLTNALFERIEISQRRMNRTEQILAFNREISDKIKILGINASIEAYAAGDKGKGFRVIANEVVTISNNMLDSLKEINELINSVMRTSDKLGIEKERYSSAIQSHRLLINELKKEINEVGFVVEQIK